MVVLAVGGGDSGGGDRYLPGSAGGVGLIECLPEAVRGGGLSLLGCQSAGGGRAGGAANGDLITEVITIRLIEPPASSGRRRRRRGGSRWEVRPFEGELRTPRMRRRTAASLFCRRWGSAMEVLKKAGELNPTALTERRLSNQTAERTPYNPIIKRGHFARPVFMER